MDLTSVAKLVCKRTLRYMKVSENGGTTVPPNLGFNANDDPILDDFIYPYLGKPPYVGDSMYT